MLHKFPLKQFALVVLLSLNVLLFSSCSKDEDPDAPSTSNGMEEARLTDFQLSETSYIDIDIDHPVITEGRETTHGTIRITIPHSAQTLLLSLKQSMLDQKKFNISPSIGLQQDFSKGAVTYTIASVTNQEHIVHYDVTVEFGDAPFFTNLKVTSFRFDKAKNPQLASSIDAVKIQVYENGTENGIFVIVPQGTDFSNLTPTITFDAAKLYYSVGNGYIEYPKEGVNIDFAYPKAFYIQAENSIGEKSLPYRVIVDVSNPIRFDEVQITTPDVQTGDNISSQDFFEIIEWTNVGNHPITGMSPTSYIDKTFPQQGFPENTTVITASIVNPKGGTPGVLPGQKGKINVKVKRMSIPGNYSVTAVFRPTFSFDTRVISYWPVNDKDRIEGIFELAPLSIKTNLVD